MGLRIKILILWRFTENSYGGRAGGGGGKVREKPMYKVEFPKKGT